jgi:hypothetical protein
MAAHLFCLVCFKPNVYLEALELMLLLLLQCLGWSESLLPTILLLLTVKARSRYRSAPSSSRSRGSGSELPRCRLPGTIR